MGFVSYPNLILLISGQMFEVIVTCEIFWELNGAFVICQVEAVLTFDGSKENT